MKNKHTAECKLHQICARVYWQRRQEVFHVDANFVLINVFGFFWFLNDFVLTTKLLGSTLDNF